MGLRFINPWIPVETFSRVSPLQLTSCQKKKKKKEKKHTILSFENKLFLESLGFKVKNVGARQRNAKRSRKASL